MFWDRVAAPYDLFEGIYNGKVYRETGEAVAGEIESGDVVLECACGTGAISVYIAPVCAKLIATDYSKGMLRQTAKKAGREKWQSCLAGQARIFIASSTGNPTGHFSGIWDMKMYRTKHKLKYNLMFD